MKARILCLAALLTLAAGGARAQYCAVRLNALGLATGTLNAGIDVAVGPKWSIDLDLYANPIDAPRLRTRFVAVQPGVRYWFFQPSVGSFIAAHAAYARYNVGGRNDYFSGWLSGVGLSFGHCWLLSTRWNIDVEIGVGVYRMKDTNRQRSVPYTEDEYIRHARRWVVAPSKAAVSFSYLF